MTEAVKIRKAIKKDLEVLLTYEQEVINAERPFDPTIRKGKVNYYNLLELIESNSAIVLVACYGDKIVATGYAKEKRARPYLNHITYSYLGFMYTDTAFRGQGINGRVIDVLKKWSVSKGLNEMRLTVYNDNDPAIRAYEKVGFKSHIIEMRLSLDD